MAEPTYISTQIVDQSKGNFPQITLCPSETNTDLSSNNSHNNYDLSAYKWDVLTAHGIKDYSYQANRRAGGSIL